MIQFDTIIYLASASPRRHEILQQMGVPHAVLDVPSPPGEDEPRLPGETAEHYVQRTAKEKAVRATAWITRQGLPNRPVLAADTTVVLDGDILGKPDDINHARQMLRRLSDRTHSVHTAIALACGDHLYEDVSITQVRMAPLSAAGIEAYCASGEPMGKAGAYGIQGRASLFIEHIRAAIAA